MFPMREKAGIPESMPRTVGALFLEQCDIYEETTALSFIDGNIVKTVTYGKLRKIVEDVADGLSARGLGPGGRALLVARNTPEWIFAYYAIHVCGGVDVSVNPELPHAVIARLARTVKPALALVEDPDLGEILERDAKIKVIYLNWKKEGYKNLRSLRQRFKLLGQGYRRRKPDDVASIVFKRKDLELKEPGGLLLSHSAVIKNVDAYTSSLPGTQADRLMVRFPFWHSPGRLGLLTALTRGLELQLSRGDIADDCEALQPTMLQAHPVILEDIRTRVYEGRETGGLLSGLFLRAYLLLGSQAVRALNRITGQNAVFRASERESFVQLVLDLSILIFLLPVKLAGDAAFGLRLRNRLGGNLRCILTGGAEVKPRLDLFFGMLGVSILAAYYKTEACHVIATRTLEYTGQRSRLQPGTVGPPLAGAEIKILQAGSDVSATAGAVGEIMIRGDFLFQGYLDATREYLDAGGWLYTGDRGSLSMQGELRIARRDER